MATMTGPDDAFLAPDEALHGFDEAVDLPRKEDGDEDEDKDTITPRTDDQATPPGAEAESG
jgi:hypothetical protein